MSGTRGVSAAVDAALCLLLVSASVLTLSTVSPATASDGPDARDAVDLVGSTTASVTYRPGPSSRNRTDRGTLAALLADAAVLRARGETDAAYERAVGDAVRRALAGLEGEYQVVARVRGQPSDRVVVGDAPPRRADVGAAELAVIVGTGPHGRSGIARVAVVLRGWSA